MELLPAVFGLSAIVFGFAYMVLSFLIPLRVLRRHRSFLIEAVGDDNLSIFDVVVQREIRLALLPGNFRFDDTGLIHLMRFRKAISWIVYVSLLGTLGCTLYVTRASKPV